MRMILSACMACFLTAPALAQESADTVELVSLTYHCERGVALPVVYVNEPNRPGHVVALIEGQMLVLPQVISASGARYRGTGDQAYEFWSKGDTAFVTFGNEDEPQPLLRDCIAETEGS